MTWKIEKKVCDYSNSATERLRKQGVNGVNYTVTNGPQGVSCADSEKLATRLCKALNDGKKLYRDISPRTMNADLKRMGY